MEITAKKINQFLMLKLPAAFFTGVRATFLNDRECKVEVRHRWINQNPFNSMFWAIQGMAAELSTGALMMKKIKESGKQVSMLVANNNASFSKKATGKITFICSEGEKIDAVLTEAITTREGQTIWLNSVGKNSEGMEVSSFNFQWTIKLKSP